MVVISGQGLSYQYDYRIRLNTYITEQICRAVYSAAFYREHEQTLLSGEDLEKLKLTFLSRFALYEIRNFSMGRYLSTVATCTAVLPSYTVSTYIQWNLL